MDSCELSLLRVCFFFKKMYKVFGYLIFSIKYQHWVVSNIATSVTGGGRESKNTEDLNISSENPSLKVASGHCMEVNMNISHERANIVLLKSLFFKCRVLE